MGDNFYIILKGIVGVYIRMEKEGNTNDKNEDEEENK